jgi:hypothetical protein
MVVKLNLGEASENIEDRGTTDYYNADGTLAPEFSAFSGRAAERQIGWRDYMIDSSVPKELRDKISKIEKSGSTKGLWEALKEADLYKMTGEEMYRKNSASRYNGAPMAPLEGVNQLMSTEAPVDDADKIDLEFADPRADLPEKRLRQRAAKGAIALGEDPAKLEIEMSDVQGEGQARQRATYKNAQEFREEKLKYVDELLKTRDPSQPMSLEEANFIAGLTSDEFTPLNPEAMEKLYAEKITNRLMGNTEVANAADQEQYHNIQDAVEQNVIKHEIALKFAEDRRQSYDSETGTIGHIWNITEQFIPFKSDLSKYDLEMSSWLPGSNMADQVRNLWLLPPEGFKAKIEEGYALIAAYNPLDAQDWLESVLSYSRMSEGTANVMFGVDVASSLPVGWIFKGGKAVKAATEGTQRITRPAGEVTSKIRLTDETPVTPAATADEARWADDGGPAGPDEQVAYAGKDIMKALMKEEIRLEDTLAKTGHQSEAIDVKVQKTFQELQKPAIDARDPSEFVNLSNTLQSIYNPRAWLDTGSRLTREATERIIQQVNTTKLKLTEAIADPAQANRLGLLAEQRAVELGKARMRDEFNKANDGIIDSKWNVRIQEDNPDTQINELVMTIGTPDGLAFKEFDHATQTADHLYKLRKGDYNVEQVGSEFYIQVKRPLDERDASVTSAMIETGNETPKSLANTFLGWFRNPDDLLSKLSLANRKAVTGLGQNLQAYFAAAIEPVARLNSRQKERLSRMMQINRDDPAGDGKRGFWYSGVQEYEQRYYDAFKQYPSEAETAAYMITRELSDFDWSVRSLTILRDKSRQGITNVHIKVPKKVEADQSADLDAQRMMDDGGPAVELQRTELEDVSFEGKLLDGLPESKPGDDDPGVYILKEGESIGDQKYLSDVDRKEIQRLIDEEGYKVYQQSDNMNNPFASVDTATRDRQFVIVKNAQTSNLRAEDMLPYRAGYHVEYAPGFYTKQGKFFRDGKGRLTYGGDRSLIYHVSEAAAKKYTKALDTARILLKEGKEAELAKFLPANLPHTVADLRRMVGQGTLDLDTPILYTRSGQNTRDSVRGGQAGSEFYDTSRDAYNSPYNLSTFVNRQFAQEKDLALPSIVKGSEGNPEFSFVPAKLIDPLSSMSRSMHNMVKMRVYDNYQYQALTSLVEEFGNPATLGGSVTKRSLESIRQNPLAFITDPMWNEKTLSRDKLAAAKNAHRSVVNLLGVQSELNKNVDWVLNKLVDSIFEKYGDGAATKAADFMHTKIRDPARYARSIAFHTKLGLFNPVQLFLQAQSVIHGAAVTGNLKRSYQAMGAGMLMRYLSLTADENIVKSFARKARAFGWSEDDFMESFENMRSAGIWHVEGEVADLNDIFGTNMFAGAGKRFLNKGTMFFQEGERFVRLNAWNTAYKEWKTANPGKKLGNRERNDILRRYDDLALNMTRSSTGAWQQGILSIPAQFSTYQIHLMEQMLGKRLTLAEKSRALATYSALYGVPTGIAAGTAFWPWGQDIKQAAMERGIDTNDGVMDVLMNGIIATSFEAVTGREYNISERWGPNGLSVFKEAYQGKKGLLGTLFGPAGQITPEILGGADPAARMILGIFTGDNDQVAIAAEDFGAALRNVSTVNNAYQMFYAMNAGKFMSKNEMFTGKADAFDGMMRGIFGFSPRAESDAYIKIESMSEHREAQKAAEKEFVKLYRKALQSHADPAAFKMYMTEAKSWLVMGGFRPDQYEDLVRAAIRGDTSLIDNIERSFLKNGPVEQLDDRFQMQQRKVQ